MRQNLKLRNCERVDRESPSLILLLSRQQEFRGSLFDLLSPRPQQSHHLFLQTAPKPGSQAGRSSALFDLSRPEAVGNNDHKDGLRTFLGPVREPLLPEFSDIDLMTSEEQDQELEMLMQGLLGGHEGGLDIMPPGLFDQPVTSQRNRPHQGKEKTTKRKLTDSRAFAQFRSLNNNPTSPFPILL